MHFACPQCACVLTLPAASASHLVQCPTCRTVIDVRSLGRVTAPAPVVAVPGPVRAAPAQVIATGPIVETDPARLTGERRAVRHGQPPWIALGLLLAVLACLAVVVNLAVTKWRKEAAIQAPALE